MAKFKKMENIRPGDPDFVFYCPGCKCDHGVWTSNPNFAQWQFNGDVNNPTVSPSLKITYPNPDKIEICHLFIRNGKIEYLSDCTHEFAGKTIELSEYE